MEQSEQQSREIRLSVFLTPDEFEALKAKADAQHLKVPDWLRSLALRADS